MMTMKELDLPDAPLIGTNLIEASAGTGKTYTITGLILRLILERRLPVSEILVVTYTEAATSELKDRIRKKLREAADAFAAGRTGDEFLRSLLRNNDRDLSLRLLDAALNDFDQASIFTIHGFCLRALLDHAFASGILFDTELVTDEKELHTCIARDFWRAHVYETSDLFCDYVRQQGFTLSSLGELVDKNLFNPFLRISPPAAKPECPPLEASFTEAFEATSDLWRKTRESVGSLLLSTEALKRNMYKQESIRVWIESMDSYLLGGVVSFKPCECFDRFTTCGIDKALKKGCSRPAHPFFASCDNLAQARAGLGRAYEECLMALKVEFLTYLRQELAERKQAKNILFFDDLLVRLYSALNGPGGDYLSGIIGDKFKAALIDEFQDTDAVQYEIFRKIFGTTGSSLFLIGDPKQAIYSFRGADIFAYKKARDSASPPCRFTLSENWRSTPDLVGAVNTIFSNVSNPFAFDFISCPPARPAQAKEHSFLTIDGKTPPPLDIWFLRDQKTADSPPRAGGGSGKPLNKDDARGAITTAVASEISRLIALGREGTARIGDAPVREGDIAVLVRKNREALQVQKALLDLGIHSVLFNVDTLFESREATEVLRVLSAVASPSEAKLISAALATDMLGLSGEEMHLLSTDEAKWESWLEKFGIYRDTWLRHGFFRMFRSFLVKEEVLPRLMSYPDGERRSTNILHLSEVLHQSESENSLSMYGLVKWLAIKREEDTQKGEEHQLRLESDENAVKLITIHKSKGLEYPIVFCPFTWEGSEPRKGPILFHDESDDDRPVLDLGSPEWDRYSAVAGKEILAENLRLLYVAVTRAKNRCCLAWGRINGAGTSAAAWLLHPSISEGWDGTLGSLSESYKELDENRMWEELKSLEQQSAGSISITEMKAPVAGRLPALSEDGSNLSAREFSVGIDRHWKIASYSSLVSGQHGRAEERDRDSVSVSRGHPRTSPVSGSKPSERGIADLPRGAVTGTLVHAILESLDFSSRNETETVALISEKVEQHGFDPDWITPISEMVRNVADVQIESEFGSFTLAGVPSSEMLRELEFYYPLKRLGRSDLTDALTCCMGAVSGNSIPSRVGSLRFEPLHGMMRGFIDLIVRVNGRFYLLDWKSNYLGPEVRDYAPEALRECVHENFYNLQYCLYSVALHQYLKTRVPGYSYDTHFGEVIYIFVRGVTPGSGSRYGIFRDRPPRSSIEALCSQLIEQQELAPCSKTF